MDPRTQRGVEVVAEAVGGVDERHVAGLIVRQPVGFDHPGVVLDGPVADHDVTDPQRGVQPAGDPGERDCAATEPVGQQGRHDGGVDLAHTRSDQDHLVPVEQTRVETGMRHHVASRLVQLAGQMCTLRFDSADQSHCH